jgi:hypothetical protein
MNDPISIEDYNPIFTFYFYSLLMYNFFLIQKVQCIELNEY